jgi:hypothetical protein
LPAGSNLATSIPSELSTVIAGLVPAISKR